MTSFQSHNRFGQKRIHLFVTDAHKFSKSFSKLPQPRLDTLYSGLAHGSKRKWHTYGPHSAPLSGEIGNYRISLGHERKTTI